MIAGLPVLGRTRTEMMPDSSRPLTSGCAAALRSSLLTRE